MNKVLGSDLHGPARLRFSDRSVDVYYVTGSPELGHRFLWGCAGGVATRAKANPAPLTPSHYSAVRARRRNRCAKGRRLNASGFTHRGSARGNWLYRRTMSSGIDVTWETGSQSGGAGRTVDHHFIPLRTHRPRFAAGEMPRLSSVTPNWNEQHGQISSDPWCCAP